MVKSALLALFLLLCVSASSIALPSALQPLKIDIFEGEVAQLGDYLHFIEDANHSLTVEEILALPVQHWQAANTSYPSFGITESTFWFALPLENVSTLPQNLYFHIDFPTFDEIKVYYLTDQGIRQFDTTGESFPFHTRPVAFPSFVFPLSLLPQESVIILVKADSEGAMQLPFELWQQADFFQGQLPHLIFYSAMLSIFLVMALYNAFLFIPTKEPSYLIYSAFCFCAAAFYTSQNGFLFEFVWPESPNWQSRSTLFFAGLTNCTLSCFTLSFLNLRAYPRAFYLLASFAVLSAVLSGLMFVLPVKYALYTQVVSILVVSSTVFFIGLYLWRKKHQAARYFVLAWFAFFLSALYTALGKLNIIEATYLTDHGISLGITLSILLLSFALADRISMLQKSRESAQKQALEHLNKFKSIYESVVEGIFVIDQEGNWISANPSLLKLLGYETFDSLIADLSPHIGRSFHHELYQAFVQALIGNTSLRDAHFQVRHQSGQLIWVSVNAKLVTNHEGERVYEGTVLDINDRHAHEERLKYLAIHDPLTKLYNRRALENQLIQAIGQTHAPTLSYALLYMDLDQFKLINDTCGHSAGDALLQQLAKRLDSQTPENATLARLGGDEFGVFIEGCDEAQAIQVAERYLDLISRFRFRLDDKDFTIGVSIGLFVFDKSLAKFETILSHADAACFLAKDLGRNRIHVYRELDEEVRQRQKEMEWVSTIKQSMEQNRFTLFFQHIVPAKPSNTGYHYELLLRLHLDQQTISPAAFMPAAERYDLMSSLDRWVVRHYFSWLQANPSHLEDLSVASINLSGQSVGEERFDIFLSERFREYKIPPEKICFEITESMAITKLDQTVAFINKYKRMGCRFALDDFGTGFSSYAYLKSLPVDYLKIDGVFIKNIAQDKIDFAMVKSIVEVAKTIGIETVAEYVENERVASKLQEIGIDFHQGYYKHKPEALAGLIESTLHQGST